MQHRPHDPMDQTRATTARQGFWRFGKREQQPEARPVTFDPNSCAARVIGTMPPWEFNMGAVSKHYGDLSTGKDAADPAVKHLIEDLKSIDGVSIDQNKHSDTAGKAQTKYKRCRDVILLLLLGAIATGAAAVLGPIATNDAEFGEFKTILSYGVLAVAGVCFCAVLSNFWSRARLARRRIARRQSQDADAAQVDAQREKETGKAWQWTDDDKLVAAAGVMLLAVGIGLMISQANASGFHNLAIIAMYLALMAPLAIVLYLRKSRAYEDWFTERAQAEDLRQTIFTEILKRPMTGLGEADQIKLLQLRLEYFRRYQLEVQCNYHTERGGEHASAARFADKLLWWAVAAAALGILILLLTIPPRWMEQGPLTCFAGCSWYYWFVAWLHEWIESNWGEKISHFLGVLVGVAYGSLFIRTLLSDDTRNAKRYAQTLGNFKVLANRYLPQARTAAAKGEVAAVNEFVAQVHRVMATEFTGWVVLKEQSTGNQGAGAPAAPAPTTT